MGTRDRDDLPMTPRRFIDEFMRLKRGSVTRRHFLGVTGLGLASAVMGGTSGPWNRPVFASELGGQVSVNSWPNYHDPATFEEFTRLTGVEVLLTVTGSNEEVLTRLQMGSAAWDLIVPTNYVISTYAARGLIEPIDLSRLPNYDRKTQNPRFMSAAEIDGKTYAVPKNWGTTGMAANTDELDSMPIRWREFFHLAMTDASGRTIVHDYQLTTIGNALVSLGHSFNSVDPAELARAEALLLQVKPHLFAIDSDYQPAMRAGDAWLTMCWTVDGLQLNRDIPDIEFTLGSDGGEIWTDYYAVPASAPNKPAAYALLDFLMQPEIALKEHLATGAPTTDSRVMTQLPPEIVSNRIIYPNEASLSPLEFGAAVTLTDPGRAELMARFKAA
ncbi:ABC transporter substrate-binding protein [Rhizobium sp. CAU 1783]